MKEEKKQISLRLGKNEIDLLQSLGGTTRGIKELINAHREKEEERKCRVKTIEEKFWDSIIVPVEPKMRQTYEAIVERFLKGKGRFGTVEYYQPAVMGRTGFDGETVIKHFRKLEGAGYIRFRDLSFRPTLRLQGIKMEEFAEILTEFDNFLQRKEQYVDFLAWED